MYPSFPHKVYLDSSYIIRLFQYLKDSSNIDNKKCKLLYDHLLKSKVELVTSLFALEETIFILFFKHRLLREAISKGFSRVKDFRISKPADFDSVYMKYRTIPRRIVNQTNSLGICITYPKYINPRLDATNRVRDYSLKLFEKYFCLDSKDVFHVAVARFLRINMLISCDNDFSSISEIQHYNPI